MLKDNSDDIEALPKTKLKVIFILFKASNFLKIHFELKYSNLSPQAKLLK